MFKKFKDKLKDWSKKISSHEEDETEEAKNIKETEETKKPQSKSKEKKEQKEETPKKETKKEKKSQKETRTKGKEEKSQKKNKKKKDSEQETKEIEIPTKFNVGTQNVEPNLEKIKEKGEELEKEEKKKGFLKKLSSKTVQITDEKFEEYKEDLEMILLENNVAFEVTEKILDDLEKRVTKKEIDKKNIEAEIKNNLKSIIEEILVEPQDLIKNIKEFRKDSKKPYIIMFCGVNGTGKTTSIAKVANMLKKEKLTSVMAAADTFRAASIEQISEHANNLNIPVIKHEYKTDPASVGFDAIKYAEKNNKDVVLIDTAGRMHTDKNLLQEIAKISRVCQPNKKIFVGESITGNDSIEQVKSFNEIIGIDNILLTKADIDEKGGTILSLGYVTGKPILFLGTGQKYEDIEFFDKNKFIERMDL